MEKNAKITNIEREWGRRWANTRHKGGRCEASTTPPCISICQPNTSINISKKTRK